MKSQIRLLALVASIAVLLAFQNCAPKSEKSSDNGSQNLGGGGVTCSSTHNDGSGNTQPAFTVSIANSPLIENTVTASQPNLEVWATGSNNGVAIVPTQVGTLNGVGAYTWHPCLLSGATSCPVGVFVRAFALKNGAGNTLCTTNSTSTTIQ